MAAAASSVAEAPSIQISAGNATITCGTGGAVIRYTTDGSDPRYSQSAQVYSAPFAQPEAGTVVTAAAQKEGMYHSAVAAETVA